MNTIDSLNNKVLLCILDGYGLNSKDLKNAILHAKKPNLDFLFQNYPFTEIEAGGELVGLPKGVAGNSEVGHMNLGAGRSVRQDLVRINESISNNTLEFMEPLLKCIEFCKKNNKRIHLMGLLSNGGVHSHIEHIKILGEIFLKNGIEVLLHAFMDGRDTARDSGPQFIREIENNTQIKIASIQGRSIGMDRDRRWNKIKTCYDLLIGKGQTTKLSPLEFLKNEYEKNIFDEFITPVLFNTQYAINEKDAVFFINFRPDRAIQISLALTDPKFKEFERSILPAHFLCMTPYIQDEVELPILFDKEKLTGTLSEYLSSQNKSQLKIAETEKYAHVTYFFNGGEKTPFKNETHVLIPSNREKATYDLVPEMSALLILEKLKLAINDSKIDFITANFANSDMVGHTGNYDAATKAIEVLDFCVGELYKSCIENNVTLIITADHGNSDQMIYENGDMHTSHTDAKVPFILIDKKLQNQILNVLVQSPALCDVAPTILKIFGLKSPSTFTGNSIF